MRRPMLALGAVISLALASPTFAASSANQQSLAQPLQPSTQALLMTATRPVLFADLIPFDLERHRRLTLPAQRTHFRFAASANLLPLNFAEVALAGAHYPIVFVAEGETVALVALAGLQPGRNHFVDAAGEWRADTYIPAYVRGYPFIALRPSPDAEPVLALDPQATDFTRIDGVRLLTDDGQPGEQLKGIIAFQHEYRLLADRTQLMTAALRQAGVLEPGQLQVKGEGGDTRQIDGFLLVNEARLKALPAAALHTLMEADALGLAYAQIFSMRSLGNVFKALAAVPSAPTLEKPTAKPRARRAKKVAE